MTLDPRHPRVLASLRDGGALSPSTVQCLDCGGHGRSLLTGRTCQACDGAGVLAIRQPNPSLFTLTPKE